MNKLFQIGDLIFSLTCPEELLLPDNFLLFERKQGRPEYTYQIRITDQLPLPEGRIIARRSDLTVYKTISGESRLIGIKGQNNYYACYQEVSDRQAEVLLAVREITDLHIDPVFVSLFALERRVITHHCLILHCAYMVYQEKAILFSAPSGTGKSTQAELWERYRGSRTVNGDRALLQKINGQWTAGGWPVCGSSDICRLEDTPVHAIVMLQQGKENQIEKLSPVQAFSQLYSQVTVNQWNHEFVMCAMDIIEDLIRQVPVYQLTCDMTENAVKCLENVLFIEEN